MTMKKSILPAWIFLIFISFFLWSMVAHAGLYVAPLSLEQDDNGEPCGGCQLYFYIEGTSTPKTVYEDVAMTVPHANPVVADAAGRFEPIFLDGSYKIILKDADDVTIWTEDNYTSGTSSDFFGETESLNSTTAINASYEKKHLRVTGSTNLNLLSVATAGEGFMFSMRNDGTGLVTIDPNGSEQINDAVSAVVPPGGSGIVICSGSEWSFINTLGIPASLANGDIFYNGTTTGLTRLPAAVNGEFLGLTSGLPSWKSITDYTDTVITPSDEILFGDVSDTNLHKKDTVQGVLDLVILPNFLTGLTLSNDTDTDHDIAIATGWATDSANGKTLRLASGLVKQIDASWAVGTNQGGLFSGTVANNTTYHVFIIEKDSDGTIDAGFDTSITAANKPAGYTRYRRVGSVVSDGSANIINFIQRGDDFYYKTPILDINDGTTGTSAKTAALSVPTGINVMTYMNGFIADNTYVYISSPDVNDAAPATNAAPLATFGSGAAGAANLFGAIRVWTNTSATIRYRSQQDTILRMVTLGYMDTRGK